MLLDITFHSHFDYVDLFNKEINKFVIKQILIKLQYVLNKTSLKDNVSSIKRARNKNKQIIFLKPSLLFNCNINANIHKKAYYLLIILKCT